MLYIAQVGGIVLAVLLLVVLGVTFLVSPNRFKPQLEAGLGAALGRRVTVGSLSFSLVSGAVAAAEYMLEITIQYCKERKAFGKPLSKFQNTQFEIVEMAADVKLGRTFLDKLIADHMEGKEIVVDVSMAKFWTTDMASRVADRCLQLHGGYGYCEEYPIARAWRDIRVTRIFAGTNEIMKTIAARFMGL